MKSASLAPPPTTARFFELPTEATAAVAVEFAEVELDDAGNAVSSTSQTVPSAGSVPFAKYAREYPIVHNEASATDVC